MPWCLYDLSWGVQVGRKDNGEQNPEDHYFFRILRPSPLGSKYFMGFRPDLFKMKSSEFL